MVLLDRASVCLASLFLALILLDVRRSLSISTFCFAGLAFPFDSLFFLSILLFLVAGIAVTGLARPRLVERGRAGAWARALELPF